MTWSIQWLVYSRCVKIAMSLQLDICAVILGLLCFGLLHYWLLGLLVVQKMGQTVQFWIIINIFINIHEYANEIIFI